MRSIIGHGGVCYDCANRLVAVAPHQCHLCRRRVLKVSRLKLDHMDEESGEMQFSVLPGGTGTALNQDENGASRGEAHAGGTVVQTHRGTKFGDPFGDIAFNFVFKRVLEVVATLPWTRTCPRILPYLRNSCSRRHMLMT